MIKTIIKRDGSKEDFQPSKVNDWATWASEDIRSRVDWNSVVMNAVGKCTTETKSEDLQQMLIKECVQTKLWPENLMAGRLYASLMRKEIFPTGIPTIAKQHDDMVKLGQMIDMGYTPEEYVQVEKLIDHTRDFHMAYFQLKQLRKKYSLTDLVKGVEFETPQFIFMRMAMTLASSYTGDIKMVHIENWYNHFSFARINAPTPNYTNLGTGHNGFASCCLYTSGDDAKSLAVGDHIAYTMSYMSAGIGGYINSRSYGDAVRGGKIVHQGKLPYFESVAKAVKANTQGGRGGACTEYFSIYDPEVETLIMLQNPRTPVDKQNRDIHFAAMFNRLFARKVAREEPIFLFNVKTAPDLHALLFTDKQDEFEALYNKYDQDDTFPKKYLDARKLMLMLYEQRQEVATLYTAMIDEINRHTPFNEPIYSSNLCVAPETPILTKEFGYKSISECANLENVHVWNGDKWSEVNVVKTGENQKLVTVVTDSGTIIDATLYHRWAVQEQNAYGGMTKTVIKKTHELVPGDKLVKFDLDVVDHGETNLELAYDNGFFTGDGCDLIGKRKRIYLYNEKKNLFAEFANDPLVNISRTSTCSDRIEIDYKANCLKDKFFIPSNEYTLASRLTWLAGLLDADGCVTDNQGALSVQLVSVNYDFLTRLRLTLQELGVNSSIRKAMDAGLRQMPDHQGGSKAYYCKNTWRILISNEELIKLQELGLNTKRLVLDKLRPGNRSAIRFTSIVGVYDNERYDDTYCFTEPEKGMGVFAGVLTHNCLEITEVTRPYESMEDLYSPTDCSQVIFSDVDGKISTFKGEDLFATNRGMLSGLMLEVGDYLVAHNIHIGRIISKKYSPEVATCSLGGLVITNIHTEEMYASAAYYALLMIDRCIHMSHYELPNIGYTAKNRINAAVGTLGLAYHLAKKGLKYDTTEGLIEIDKVFERHAYHVISASLKLGQELGNAPWMHKTKWPKGWLPIDTYKRTVDQLVPFELRYDWEDLRSRIIENGGIRNSALIAHPPTESSSKASGPPNNVYPVRDLTLKKSDAKNVLDWCAPDNDLLEHAYQLAWKIKVVPQIHMYAVVQKWTDHTISADIYRDRVENPIVTSDDLIEEFLAMVKFGVKTEYYQNSFTTKVSALSATNLDRTSPAGLPGEGITDFEGTSFVHDGQGSMTDYGRRATDLIAVVDEEQRGCPGGFCSL